MINYLGKTLVFLTLAGSLFALTWAAAIFFQKVDWGWKEPRKDLDQRVASELDKRIAAHAQALRAVARFKDEPARSHGELLTVRRAFPANHLFYVAELKRLRESPDDPLDVKGVQYSGGVIQLDAPVVGKPVLAEAVTGITKSREGYEAELASVQKAITKTNQAIEAWVAKEKELTLKLIGVRDDQGKVVKMGVYDLLEEEKRAQDQARYERDEYLEPRTVRARQEASQQRDRNRRMQGTLDRFLKGGK